MIVDGKAIAQSVLQELTDKGVQGLRLGVLFSAGNAATRSFVSIKARAATELGVTMVERELSSEASTEEALQHLKTLIEATDGVILQMPLLSAIDIEALLQALPATHDVDGLTSHAHVRPPVAEAVREILLRSHVELRGREAVVVGRGRLVGAPCAQLLKELGARVRVLELGDSLLPLSLADVVVLGAGSPGLVIPSMLKEGTVLVDAGTSESGGKLMGDADPACASVASIYTPVPGGIGPVAVAMLFRNLAALARKG